jgi:glycosyltransferase involved in cell wall biosynthesis
MLHREVVVIQQYVPKYRAPFFRELTAALASRQVRLQVVAGRPSANQAARGDAATEGFIPARSLTIGMGTREISVRLPGEALQAADLVIVEQALRNLETYWLFAGARLGAAPVALWGHGRAGVKKRTRLEERVKRMLTNRAHWFFAYTDEGARYISARGFPSDRITIVRNTIDTAELDLARRSLSDAEANEFARDHCLTDRPVAIYVGSLDAHKRIEFLVHAGAKVQEEIPDFVLVVAGDGPARGPIEDAGSETGWLRYLGRADTRTKALLSRVSQLMMMPGGVGLAVVDAFVMKTPLVTTAWPFHGPEFEYLQNGWNGVVAENEIEAYADAVTSLLRNPSRLLRLRKGCETSASKYSLQTMVETFSAGVTAALDAPRR